MYSVRAAEGTSASTHRLAAGIRVTRLSPDAAPLLLASMHRQAAPSHRCHGAHTCRHAGGAAAHPLLPAAVCPLSAAQHKALGTPARVPRREPRGCQSAGQAPRCSKRPPVVDSDSEAQPSTSGDPAPPSPAPPKELTPAAAALPREDARYEPLIAWVAAAVAFGAGIWYVQGAEKAEVRCGPSAEGAGNGRGGGTGEVGGGGAPPRKGGQGCSRIGQTGRCRAVDNNLQRGVGALVVLGRRCRYVCVPSTRCKQKGGESFLLPESTRGRGRVSGGCRYQIWLGALVGWGGGGGDWASSVALSFGCSLRTGTAPVQAARLAPHGVL